MRYRVIALPLVRHSTPHARKTDSPIVTWHSGLLRIIQAFGGKFGIRERENVHLCMSIVNRHADAMRTVRSQQRTVWCEYSKLELEWS